MTPTYRQILIQMTVEFQILQFLFSGLEAVDLADLAEPLSWR
jgi:hypothetical protein